MALGILAKQSGVKFVDRQQGSHPLDHHVVAVDQRGAAGMAEDRLDLVAAVAGDGGGLGGGVADQAAREFRPVGVRC